jgi:hypothetical protein
MKTLILKETKISIYLFDDKKEVLIADDKTIVGNVDHPDFYIADCNSENSELITNVVAPKDWIGHKYKYENNFILIEQTIEQAI